jgi:hypothetical protein
MNTDIEYLKQLEVDLRDAAVREEASRTSTGGGGRRRRLGNVWIRAAAAAAFLVVAGAIGFIASGGSRQMFQASENAVAGVGEAPQASMAPVAGPAEERNVFDEDAGGQRPSDLSKIIRDGRIGVIVPDGSFDDTVGDLTFIAEEHGGFVLSSSTRNERSGTFVLRIPAKGFDQALADIRALGNVRFQAIQGDDVTAEFIDFQARLRILQARKSLLFDLFQKAGTTEEILRLAGQLDDVQLRIEQIQGQLRFIADQVAESTLRVSIQERNAPDTAVETEVDKPDLGSSFDLAVQGFLRIVGAVIVGLGYLIPLTVLAALVWLAVWLSRRRRTA